MLRVFFLMALLRPSFGFQTLYSRRIGSSRRCCVHQYGKTRDSEAIIRGTQQQQRLILRAASQQSTRQLYSTSRETSGDSNNSEKPRRFTTPLQKVKNGVKWVLNSRARLTARFQALPRKAKRIVILQLIITVLAVGGIGKNIYAARGPPPPVEVSYSSFLDLIERQEKNAAAANGNVPVMDQVRIGTDRIVYRLYRNSKVEQGSGSGNPLPLELPALSPKGAQRLMKQQQQRPYMTAFTRRIPSATPPELVNQLRSNKIPFAAATTPRVSTLAVALRTFMVAFYFLILFRIYKTVSGGGGGVGKGDTPGKLAQSSELPLASFDDIQGIPAAKAEVMELVDALRNPDKYAILGARAPTGLLLVGPPGTGKTMLARATAASAGVPLIYCSGSDFVEMFVGRGAARVRRLFERAEKLSPCIIFIDELDALGKSRDAGGALYARSNDEAEQTLNQLLACMDGLDSSRRICVLAATNRKEVLDSALIRPGRFDRIVNLELPDAGGREKILRVHTSKLPGFTEGSGVDPARPGALGKGRLVDLSAVAAVTDGFSGAELEFLVNEAAIRAVRRVSSALQKGTPANDIVPHVEAMDFELSLKSFYETRKPKNARVNDILKNVWKP